jgi:DnaJ-class molecular chaperone
METISCPECGGFGYFENGTVDGIECERCHGDGTIQAKDKDVDQ